MSTYIFEPNCRAFSHESVNSYYLLKHLYSAPSDTPTRVYLFKSHFLSINSLVERRLRAFSASYIYFDDFCLFKTPSYFSRLEILLRILFLLKNIDNQSEVIFMSCTNPQVITLYLVSLFLFPKVNITFYIHSNLDLNYNLPVQRSLSNGSFLSFVKYHIKRFLLLKMYIENHFWNLKKFLLAFPLNPRIRFRVLSDHILDSLPKKILSKHSITADNLIMHKKSDFSSPFYDGLSSTLTLATQGYGNPYELNKLLFCLESSGVENISIMVIGGNPNSIRNSPLISYYPPPTALSRSDINKLMNDVDVVLILQRRDTRLVCSAAPLESISYRKPVFHYGDACTTRILQRHALHSLKCNTHIDLSESIRYFSHPANYATFYKSFIESIHSSPILN